MRGCIKCIRDHILSEGKNMKQKKLVKTVILVLSAAMIGGCGVQPFQNPRAALTELMSL